MDNSNRKGFTLIELLVVVAIIGILASIVLVSLGTARERGRDAKRMRDIQEIRNAIELYILANGHAPDFGDPACGDPTSVSFYCYANDFDPTTDVSPFTWAQLQTELSPYINKLPVDPCGVSCFQKSGAYDKSKGFFTYRYTAPGESFGLAESGTLSASDYNIYAQSLEAKSEHFGFGPGSF